MTFIQEKIQLTCQNLSQRIAVRTQRIEEMAMLRVPYKTANTPPDGDWARYRGGPIDFPRDSHAWFCFTADVPETGEDEAVWLRFTTGREGQWDAQNPQGTVFIDGDTAVQALDTNHTEVRVPSGRHEIRIYFYGGTSAATLTLNAALVTKRISVEKLYWDLFVPLCAMKSLPRGSFAYNEIANALDHACLLIDFRESGSDAFYESVLEADRWLEKEFYEKRCGRDTLGEIALIGHTHIDVAWLWTLAQTAEKAQRSFSTVIALMEQYPDYVFMSSQPQLYQYVKENDPALYEKIKARIAEGRWEPEGAMWLEADTNLVSGESLVRQLLYGKKFMREEFGAENHILWLPDVFGYSAALPQILKKSGVDTFFTTKLSWCETDKFPHDNFVWQGIDGSEVFAVLSESYVKRLEPQMILSSVDRHVDKKYSTTQLSTFGFGDGGGGPTKEMLEHYERLKRGLPGFPRVTMKPSADTIAEIRAQFEETAELIRFVPKWVGELYLEMHRGTYTTMAKNKLSNRRAELLYQTAEALSAAACLLAGRDYPKAALEENWHTILKNQFHDIIPGSSIKDVYDVSHAEYAAVLAAGERLADEATAALAAGIGSQGGTLLVNPAPFARTETLADGTQAAIPAHGWTVAPAAPAAAPAVSGGVFGGVLENDTVRVVFDKKLHISSVFDKRAGREVIAAGQRANVLEVFEDYPREYDAWEITEYYKQKMWIADDVTAVEPLRGVGSVGVRVTRRYGRSTIRQDVVLHDGSARLDFHTEIDWHEDHVLLKAAFPLALRASHVNYEIQFGHIERPTHRNTSWDEAKFEVCAHKWADMSEADYGAAILNDAKYGYSCEENVLKLSLLKAPTYPNPEADRGRHEFTYSLYPHAGNLAQSDVVREAYLLNQPVRACAIAAQPDGPLPQMYTFAAADEARAVLETIKAAEDGRGLVLRFYDAQNAQGAVTLRFGFPVRAAFACDMMENDECDLTAALAADGRSLTLPLANFEIKTIRVIPQ